MKRRCSICDSILTPKAIAAIDGDEELKKLRASAEEIKEASMEARYRWSLFEKREHNLHVEADQA